jgi:hypothetical protein
MKKFVREQCTYVFWVNLYAHKQLFVYKYIFERNNEIFVYNKRHRWIARSTVYLLHTAVLYATK